MATGRASRRAGLMVRLTPAPIAVRLSCGVTVCSQVSPADDRCFQVDKGMDAPARLRVGQVVFATRFGALPARFDPGVDPVDGFTIDREYWRPFWYRPEAANGRPCLDLEGPRSQ
jgi:hypothetical protein